MAPNAKPDSKVLFRVVNENDPEDVNVETLWATALGEDRYRLDNSPFFAYSASWKDVVHAPMDADEGFPTFQRVLEKSGNRTVRAILDEPLEEGNPADQIMQGLVAMGCTYEGARRRYFSINIPPAVELDDVGLYLNEHKVRWEHADPTEAELYPDDA